MRKCSGLSAGLLLTLALAGVFMKRGRMGRVSGVTRRLIGDGPYLLSLDRSFFL